MNFLLSPIKSAIGVASALALGVCMTSAGIAEPQPELAIGSKAPLADVLMMNVNGTQMSLNTAAGPNGLLVVFSCNTCPFVVGNGEKSDRWEGRYNEVIAFARENGIGSVLVNSNEAKRKGDDSLEEMKQHAREAGYIAPYVVDARHKLADGFGARTTPHIYLFAGDFRLVYRGSIDDSVNSAADVKERYLEDAITKMVAGKKVKPAITKAIGCSIKRMS